MSSSACIFSLWGFKSNCKIKLPMKCYPTSNIWLNSPFLISLCENFSMKGLSERKRGKDVNIWGLAHQETTEETWKASKQAAYNHSVPPLSFPGFLYFKDHRWSAPSSHKCPVMTVLCCRKLFLICGHTVSHSVNMHSHTSALGWAPIRPMDRRTLNKVPKDPLDPQSPGGGAPL